MKVGILGGTFNPIHLGHLVLAEQVREELALDKIIFVPAYLPPHKDSNDIAPVADRFKMVKLAIGDNKYFKVSDAEIKRGGRSYSVDTLKYFKNSLSKKDELYFITGSDVLKYLGEWKDADDIFALAKFVVATRPGYPLENLPGRVMIVPIKAVDVSAFHIRKQIQQGKSVRYLVPQEVIQYIKKRGLYR